MSPGRFRWLSPTAAVSICNSLFISYAALTDSIDPTSNDDFETIIAAMRIPELSEGHQCYPVPNPSADVEAFSNATLQIRYTSDFEDDRNETYYACADITYVPTSQFAYQVPCFNATVDDYDISDNNDSDSGSTASAAGASATSATPDSSKSGSSGLSGGAIAGIVVGVVVGVAAVMGVFIFMRRKSQQKKRVRQQEASLRTVKWEEHMQG